MLYDNKWLKLTKKETANLCGRLDLGNLKKSAKESKQLCRSPWFWVKTHKPEKPFRVIIEDKGTWQRHVAKYLQLHLAKLPVQDPFMNKGSEEVIQLLKESEPVTCASVDVKDM
ncbi:hypothetical protein HPB48_015990 [Haemaphysalis longicornis]|uniref:Uncharacterized protein n=1 Tax=Haemaphysalis longicornis TaxID=44386 RepID=A0A9J6GV82_HAELO|nr:hypothetical protein HPB48_015990 [Haemaphysalis longicornis]